MNSCQLDYKYCRERSAPALQLFDRRLMQLMTFLTRRQAWLTPLEISKRFRANGKKVSVRTIHRWFAVLREVGGFVYYPYPRANVLGLQDVLVRVWGLRAPEILSVLPFGASFSCEVGLGDGVPFVSQGYWVPGPRLGDFDEYWDTAKDLGLLSKVEMLRARNTHFVFSPFHEVTREEGVAGPIGPVDNDYFEELLRRNLAGPFDVAIGEAIARSPLIVPIVVEHIWEHFSSRQVWRAIASMGEAQILEYFKEKDARALTKPGSALRLLQQQWRDLLTHFDELFLQPRVFFDWMSLGRTMFLSLLIHAGSVDRLRQAAMQASERSIVTSLRPATRLDGWGHISCFLAEDQLLPLLRIVQEHHRDSAPPTISIQDRAATVSLFEPSFCKLDWRLFDTQELLWRFPTERYLERLKQIRPSS